MSIIEDMFKTNGKWDASATGWALAAWMLTVLTFLIIAIFHHPSLQEFGIAAGSVLGGGGLGTLLHSRSTP